MARILVVLAISFIATIAALPYSSLSGLKEDYSPRKIPATLVDLDEPVNESKSVDKSKKVDSAEPTLQDKKPSHGDSSLLDLDVDLDFGKGASSSSLDNQIMAILKNLLNGGDADFDLNEVLGEEGEGSDKEKERLIDLLLGNEDSNEGKEGQLSVLKTLLLNDLFGVDLDVGNIIGGESASGRGNEGKGSSIENDLLYKLDEDSRRLVGGRGTKRALE